MEPVRRLRFIRREISLDPFFAEVDGFAGFLWKKGYLKCRIGMNAWRIHKPQVIFSIRENRFQFDVSVRIAFGGQRRIPMSIGI